MEVGGKARGRREEMKWVSGGCPTLTGVFQGHVPRNNNPALTAANQMHLHTRRTMVQMAIHPVTSPCMPCMHGPGGGGEGEERLLPRNRIYSESNRSVAGDRPPGGQTITGGRPFWAGTDTHHVRRERHGHDAALDTALDRR